MPNLFSLIKPRGTKESNQRQNFDLNNGHVYSQKAGIIDVVKCLHTVPKDFFDIDVADFTQTTAMNTAAFLRARKEISAYYVPYNYLWSNFNQYQATREDPKSAALKSLGIAYEPRIPLWVLYLTVCEQFFSWYYCTRVMKASLFASLASNNQLHGVSSIEEYEDKYSQRIQQEVDLWLGQSVWNWDFLTGVRLNPNAEDPWRHYWRENLPRKNWVCDVTGNYVWNYAVRKLDMLGYGNLYPLLKELEIEFDQVFERDYNEMSRFWFEDGQLNTYTVAFWDNILESTGGLFLTFERNVLLQLRNMCGTRNEYGSSVNYENFRYVSAYPLYAYNHIFYHMFRNSYYDLNYDVQNYSLDFLNCSQWVSSVIKFEDLPSRFFELGHHQYKKDMFTGVLPDVQFGVVSSVDISNVSITGIGSLSGSTGSDAGRWRQVANPNLGIFGNSNNIITSPSGSNDNTLYVDREGSFAAFHTHAVDGTVNISSSASIPAAFNVLALKRAEMLQVYHQQLMRAGNRTSDIFKAIYGSDPKSEMHHTPYFVEVMGEDFNLNPVVSTANTGVGDNPSLGDIAARGVMSGNRTMKFSTDDFGCLMFLAYIVPDVYYNSTQIDPHLMNLTPEDHLIPELMNLGFSPVLGEWISNYVSQTTDLNTVRGYAPPYLEFKTDIPKAHGAFASTALYTINETLTSRLKGTLYGSLSHWIPTRVDLQSLSATTLSQFYINPNVLDNIFVVQNDDTYESDQFICHTYLKVSAVRQFSALGLPSF